MRSDSLIIIVSLLMFLGINSCDRKISPFEKNSLAVSYTYKESKINEFALSLASYPENLRDSAVFNFIKQHPLTPVIESDSIFSLYWWGKASQVLVNGDLQAGWAKPDTMNRLSFQSNNFFWISYKIPSDSRVDYTLTIDAMSTPDPRNPVITPGGYGSHSQVAMTGFTPDQVRLLRDDIQHGCIDSMDFKSSNTSIVPRKLKIFLPAGYDSLSELPVIYILDGLEALEFMSYNNVLDNLISDGKIEPVLAVFIPPGEHHAEKIADKSKAFLKVVCDEIVPLIDRTYKTDPGPEKRAIAGISSGGHFALLAMFSRNDVFHCAAGQSPTLSDVIFDELHEMIRKGRYDQNMKIYIDAGIFDLPGGTLDDLSFLGATRNLNGEMEIHKISHLYQEFNDGHEWANWRERTDDVLIYFFGK